MGAVFKKTYAKPVPAGAKIVTKGGKRYARWQTGQGKTQTAPLNEKGNRILVRAKTYVAKYRDGSGRVIEKATGCRDETAAKHKLRELERRAEHVKAGILSHAQERMAERSKVLLAEHMDDFIEGMVARDNRPEHCKTTRRYLERIAEDCGFAKLPDLDRPTLERWLAARKRDGLSARTRNAYQTAMVSFGNWAVETDRLASNPFSRMRQANEKADRRRQHRALTEGELEDLLKAAKDRPLLDAMTVHHGPRKGLPVARVREEVKRKLEMRGHERMLAYKTLVLSGMRPHRELASLTQTPSRFYTLGPKRVGLIARRICSWLLLSVTTREILKPFLRSLMYTLYMVSSSIKAVSGEMPCSCRW